MAKRLAGLFTKPFQRRSSGRLQPINIRDFSGGLNAIDDDELLNVKYAKQLKNFYRGTDGSLCLRFGTFRFADVASVVTGDIIDGTFFKEALIYVTDAGHIVKVDEDGVPTAIWNGTIAAALPGVPSGWSGGLTQVTFVTFSSELIIHNGIDKPVTIDTDYNVTYLNDLATGSNVNVPIGKYGCTAASYHCVAGIPDEPTLIVLSATKAAGTFPGDPAPNDAIEIDVGAYAPSETTEIQGIAGYRNNLIVFFRQDSLIITLGNYIDDIHVPQFTDVMPHFGLLSQRSLVPVENDLFFAGSIGVASAKRNLLAGLVESLPLSSLIKPRYMTEIRAETTEDLQQYSFAVHNEISSKGSGQAMFFSPNKTIFVYTFVPDMKIKAWSEYIGWDWVVSACQSAQGRVFLTDGTKVFQHGNDIFEGEDVTADRVGDYDQTWANNVNYAFENLVLDPNDGLVYKANIAHTSAASGTFVLDREANPDNWDEYLGEPIDFEWELPWIDARSPMNVKHTKYMRVGSKGNAPFTVDAFADGMYAGNFNALQLDGEDLIFDEEVLIMLDGDEIPWAPGLSLNLVGNEFPQWGPPGEDIEFGGGRPSNYPKLYSFPIKFERLKLLISGSTREPLRLLWIMLMYKLGSLHR